MFSIQLMPRFSETDALGHINNTVVPIWFEAGRVEIFKIFVPDLDTTQWKLIVANINVDYIAQIYMEYEVEIRTGIQKIGNSSFVVYHEAIQKGQVVAKGTAVMVHYDFSEQKSKPIPNELREHLQRHLVANETNE
ncbi:acyl-CoA thioesterase [Fodinisporobacter ferrooxydans]|uniref:Acyl-CoA thioesterase n=1 Tax=Fodinisporobacter ferrooxydans TaxID=2901836 RepID=A0ABY4CMP9_9BACL|nr:acyl-CoA thioesterase [Alicyclobacillaceae bacterium MYW30-H2]